MKSKRKLGGDDARDPSSGGNASEGHDSHWNRMRWGAAFVLLGVFLWAYLPVLMSIHESWRREQDYSHGYLVVPLAVYFLWLRRSEMPRWSNGFAWGGLGLIAASVLVRCFGAGIYVDAIVGWSIPLWFAGVCWLLFGRHVAWWAAPAICFLLFMVPLPYVLEHSLSRPLQSASTTISSFAFQCCYLPAVSEGNTILLGDERLEVERACSGLRIFFGIVALAYAMLTVAPRSWFIRGLVLLSVAPIALIANAGRIFVTGVLFHVGFHENYGDLIHDAAGWLMIPSAALLFWAFLAYVDRLFPCNQTVDLGDIL
ncbi:MAG: exosortase/archaeosortase family protein [Planctomycetota bacterium]